MTKMTQEVEERVRHRQHDSIVVAAEAEDVISSSGREDANEMGWGGLAACCHQWSDVLASIQSHDQETIAAVPSPRVASR